MATSRIKYIYDLPLFARKELCRVIDETGKWEDLGGNHMNLSVSTLKEIQRTTIARAMSPTDYLLDLLGQKNYTIDYVFVVLSKMQHYRGMSTIKDFVDQKLLALMYDGECNLSRIVAEKSEEIKRAPLADMRKAASPAGPSAVAKVEHRSQHISFTGTTGYHANIDKLEQKGNVNKSIGQLNPEIRVSPIPAVAVPTTQQQQLSPVVARTLPSGSFTDNERHLSSSRKSPVNPEPARGSSPFHAPLPPEHCQVPFLEFRQVLEATNNFDQINKLGKGGFGTVFKGNWQNTEVAIKRLEYKNSVASGDEKDDQVAMEQILVEFTSLRRYAHDNILPLYAYSVGGEYPCLVYKLMPRGSLEDRLQCKPLWQGRVATAPLTWKVRAKIALGVARGLQFLHSVHEKPLIHGDVKSGNILLDENFEPKIGDFGLAREGPDKGQSSMLASKIQGTRPYLPPEFLRSGRRSTKVDVYSFGIVLFEVTTGQRAGAQANRPCLIDFVRYHSRKESLDEIMDRPRFLNSNDINHAIFRLLVELGLRCVHEDPKQRPEMKEVYDELWHKMAALEESRRVPNVLPEPTEDNSESDSEYENTDDLSGETHQSRASVSAPGLSPSRLNQIPPASQADAGMPLLSFLLGLGPDPSPEGDRNVSPAPIPDFSRLGFGSEVDAVKQAFGEDVDTQKLGEALRPLVLLSQENNATARAVTALLPAITALLVERNESQRGRRESRQPSGEPRRQEVELPSMLLPALSALNARDSKSKQSSNNEPSPVPDLSALYGNAVQPALANLPDFSALNFVSSEVPNHSEPGSSKSETSAISSVDLSIQSGYSSSISSRSHIFSDCDDDIVVPTASKKKLAI